MLLMSRPWKPTEMWGTLRVSFSQTRWTTSFWNKYFGIFLFEACCCLMLRSSPVKRSAGGFSSLNFEMAFPERNAPSNCQTLHKLFCLSGAKIFLFCGKGGETVKRSVCAFVAEYWISTLYWSKRISCIKRSLKKAGKCHARLVLSSQWSCSLSGLFLRRKRLMTRFHFLIQ